MPQEQIGVAGCNLVKLTVDSVIGDEVCVMFKEDPDYAEQYASVRPINMFAHTGAVNTPHGAVAFIVWQIAAGSPCEVFVETFFNPAASGELISEAARQTHLKLIIINNRTSAVTAFVDYANVFGLDELAAFIEQMDAPASGQDFHLATNHVLTHIDLVSLVRDGAQSG
ncbi:hypothetical protein I603_1559 [Erythrobacter dokdonensis DSW-74]|uniref:Uncharacterized protein n=1 Tax=Erythrobacter dokdonensis DSW-74 TaxID=1300349 RepID=A0A1A7BHF8_9SPHN|nr:hypothetical protein I603_1559 [Erythrobacter dokdonensis DSW-74]